MPGNQNISDWIATRMSHRNNFHCLQTNFQTGIILIPDKMNIATMEAITNAAVIRKLFSLSSLLVMNFR